MDAPRKQKISRYPMNDKPSKNKAKNTGLPMRGSPAVEKSHWKRPLPNEEAGGR